MSFFFRNGDIPSYENSSLKLVGNVSQVAPSFSFILESVEPKSTCSSNVLLARLACLPHR